MNLTKSVCVAFKRDCLSSSLPVTQSHWFLQPEVMGTYLPGSGTLGWGA